MEVVFWDYIDICLVISRFRTREKFEGHLEKILLHHWLEGLQKIILLNIFIFFPSACQTCYSYMLQTEQVGMSSIFNCSKISIFCVNFGENFFYILFVLKSHRLYPKHKICHYIYSYFLFSNFSFNLFHYYF